MPEPLSPQRLAVTYSEKHPHEPEIPPALDAEGRCLVCVLLVKLERAEAERDKALEALTAVKADLDHALGVRDEAVAVFAAELLTRIEDCEALSASGGEQ